MPLAPTTGYESEGIRLDLVDDKWREEKLPHEDVKVPAHLLPDPEADNGESHLTLREQEQRWTDLDLSTFTEGSQTGTAN